MTTLFSCQAGNHHLRRLIILRGIAIAVQCLVLALVYRYLEWSLDWLPMLATVCALAVLNLLTWWRLRADYPVSNGELFAQLSADVLGLSVLLYYGGGSTNPFISLFLLPLVIAAATLPRGYTWGMAALTTLCYTLLMKYFIPLPIPAASANNGRHVAGMDHVMGGMPQDNTFSLHILGMWLGYVLSAVIIAWFVVKMAQAVRERDESLTRVREETLRNERIVALGTQAAGAAHELGTPLSTMSVVIGELQHDSIAVPEWRDSLQLLNVQVHNCRRILDKLLANAQDAETQGSQPLEQFLADTLDEWHLLRPVAHHRYHASGTRPVPHISTDPSLRAALLNLLNNAADASPEEIDIHAKWDAENLTLEISDRGLGLAAEAAARAGSAFFTTKHEGRGLGLFLANATLERLGGNVRLFNREGGGATTEVTLPLQGAGA